VQGRRGGHAGRQGRHPPAQRGARRSLVGALRCGRMRAQLHVLSNRRRPAHRATGDGRSAKLATCESGAGARRRSAPAGLASPCIPSLPPLKRPAPWLPRPPLLWRTSGRAGIILHEALSSNMQASESGGLPQRCGQRRKYGPAAASLGPRGSAIAPSLTVCAGGDQEERPEEDERRSRARHPKCRLA
jgi:hypothetical protein